MAMIGALLAAEKFPTKEDVFKAFTKVFGENKSKFIPINEEAIVQGAGYAEDK